MPEAGFRPNSQTALRACWYVPRLVDYPVAIYSSSVVLESMAILIAPNRFTYPTLAFISVHQRSGFGLHQRSEKTT
jgi:hypothetical protein